MKKIISIISVLIALAGCASRELDVLVNVDNTEVTDPSDDSAPIEKGRIVTISAGVSDNPDTKSEVSDGGRFVWNTGDKIGVYTNGGDMKSFSYVSGSGKTFVSDEEFAKDETVGDIAIAPYSDDNTFIDLGSGENQLRITIPSTPDWEEGNSNAVMIATGMGASDDMEQVFEFHHIGAVMKFTYENVPVGAVGFVLTTATSTGEARNIAGDFVFENISDFSTVKLENPSSNGTNTVMLSFDEVTKVNTSMTFFVPVPTGAYSKFELYLVDDSFEVIDGTKKKATWSVTLKPADVLVFPAITLTPADVVLGDYEEVSSGTAIVDGDYILVNKDRSKVFSGVTNDVGTVASITIESDGSILSTNGNSYVINVARTDDSHWTMKMGSVYLALTSSDNKIHTSDDPSSNAAKWDLTYNSIQSVNYTTRFLYYNDNNSSPRICCYTSSFSNPEILTFYKRKGSDTIGRLCSPRNMNIINRRITWDSVPTAVSYIVTIEGEDPETTNNTYYDLPANLEDDYYDVSVVAKSGDTKHKDSAPALIEGACFGTPKMTPPENLSIVNNSCYAKDFSVSWEDEYGDSYHYILKKKSDGSVICSDITTEKTLYFGGLTPLTEYSVEVYVDAKTFSGKYYYEDSPVASIDQTTAAEETLSSIIANGGTGYHKVYDVTVGAVSSKGIFVFDGETGIFVYQAETNPNDLSIGDVVNVQGKVGNNNSNFRFKEEVSIEKTSGSVSVNPYSIVEMDATGMNNRLSAESFSVGYVSFFASVKSTSDKELKLGSENTNAVRLYNPISNLVTGMANNDEVVVTGWTMQKTGSGKYLNVIADSYRKIQLTASPTSATWSTWKDLTSKTITVTSDDSAWTFNDSAVSSWLSVTRGTGENINKLTLTPKSTNDSKTAREPANITLTHATVSGKTTTIACSMPAKPTVGNVSSTQTGRYVTLACATAGATIKYTTDGTDPAQYGVNYSTPISFTSDKRLRAVGILEDYFNSTELDQNITAPTPNLAVSGDASYDGTNKILTLGGAAASGAKTLSVTSYYAWNASKGGSDTFTFAKKDANNSAVAADVDVDLNGSITVTPPSDADTARDLGTLTLTDSQGTEISITIKQAAKGNAPAAGTVLFSDSFTSAANGASARVYYSSSSSTAAYDVEKYNSTLTYTSSGGVSCESTSYAGGSAKEIQVNKNGGSLTISGIKTYGATTVNVSFKYKCNLTTAPITATCGSTDSSNFSSTSATTASFNATVSGDTFNLVIRKTSTANSSAARFDDISITVVE